METLGTLHMPVKEMLGLVADGAGCVALSLGADTDEGEWHVLRSRDGFGFAILSQLTATAQSIAADSEGHIWIAQDSVVTRLTASGASTGTSFSVRPARTGKTPPYAAVLAMQCVNNVLYFITSSTAEHGSQGALETYDISSGTCSTLTKHVSSKNGFAVFCCADESHNGKVLFISNSNSLCQLDLGSKEVEVLLVRCPYPSARLFSGPGPLAALLVPDLSQSPSTSSLYSCSEEGELQLLRSGLVVTSNMLAVSKAGDVMFFQPHWDNKELSSMVRLHCPGMLSPSTPRQVKPLLLVKVRDEWVYVRLVGGVEQLLG
ncbi:hypothetical protein V8C86DRAFT_1283887 [Haematococcus lacustris]